MTAAQLSRTSSRALVWALLLITWPQIALPSSAAGAESALQPLTPALRIEYVTKLGLIQGHLWVAAQLVENGYTDLGAKHAKHPGQEVYQELLPFFSATNSPGFAAELEAMSGQFHAESLTEFRRAYADVMSTITGIVAAQNLGAQAKLQVAGALVEQASVEYRAGVRDGAVVDLQEYQDARGFVEIAHALLATDSPAQGIAAGPQERLLEQLNAVKGLWPSLKPNAETLGDGDELASLSATLAVMLEATAVEQ